MRKCPECAELIQPDARKCRFCGSAVVPFTEEEKRVLAQQPNGDPATLAGYWLGAAVISGLVTYLMVNPFIRGLLTRNSTLQAMVGVSAVDERALESQISFWSWAVFLVMTVALVVAIHNEDKKG